MQKRVWGIGCLLALALAAAWPVRAKAADAKSPTYTYIAEWAVPREQWRDYAKVTADERAAMDQLVADGTLVGYGEFSVLLHQDGHPTHGSWFTATSRAGLLKALEAIYKLPQVTFPALANSKHWDFLVVSRAHGERSGKFQGGYLSGGGFDVKPGQEKAFNEVMNKNIVPIMEKLLADGVVTSYSVDSEEFHQEAPGRVTFVYTVADAAGVDKVEDAIIAAFRNDPALESAANASVDWKGHRDFLARVGNMVNK
ncbi:MAG: hypothetical protein ACE145_00820 [Terriglobia bacterium]